MTSARCSISKPAAPKHASSISTHQHHRRGEWLLNLGTCCRRDAAASRAAYDARSNSRRRTARRTRPRRYCRSARRSRRRARLPRTRICDHRAHRRTRLGERSTVMLLAANGGNIVTTLLLDDTLSRRRRLVADSYHDGMRCRHDLIFTPSATPTGQTMPGESPSASPRLRRRLSTARPPSADRGAIWSAGSMPSRRDAPQTNCCGARGSRPTRSLRAGTRFRCCCVRPVTHGRHSHSCRPRQIWRASRRRFRRELLRSPT